MIKKTSKQKKKQTMNHSTIFQTLVQMPLIKSICAQKKTNSKQTNKNRTVLLRFRVVFNMIN